jgi:hypothetical protein
MTAPAQGIPQFEDPAAAGGKRPRIADLMGRTVFVQPLKIERGLPGLDPGSTQDRITANVTVIDGGPLQFGGKPEKHQPHTMTVSTPYTAEGVFISQTALINALSDALPSPKKPHGGVVLGVVVQGAQPSDARKSPPWLLQTLDAADPRRAQAQAVLAAVIQGHFVNPEPIDIATGIAVSAPAHVQAAQAQVAADYGLMQQQQATPQMPAVVHAPGQAPNYTTAAGIQAAVQQSYAPPAQPAAPAVDPNYLAGQAQQQAAAAAAAQPPVQQPSMPQGVAPYPTAPVDAPAQNVGPNGPAATGWPQEAWDRLQPAQANAIRATLPA